MSIKKVVAAQYKKIVDRLQALPLEVKIPPEGWLCTIRKALGMSRVQLANKLKVTRAQVFKFEKEELKGSVTIKSMHRVAEAMGCYFVYAIIPPKGVDDLIKEQAKRKARHIVSKANIQMALEEQLLANDKIQFEIDRLTQQIWHEMPSDLWNEE